MLGPPVIGHSKHEQFKSTHAVRLGEHRSARGRDRRFQAGFRSLCSRDFQERSQDRQRPYEVSRVDFSTISFISMLACIQPYVTNVTFNDAGRRFFAISAFSLHVARTVQETRRSIARWLDSWTSARR